MIFDFIWLITRVFYEKNEKNNNFFNFLIFIFFIIIYIYYVSSFFDDTA